MTTEVKLTLDTPTELPREWKELVRGIAARHDFTATPQLTGEGIDVLLSHAAHGDDIRELAMRVGGEMEQALAQRSRFAAPTTSTNVFVNNGQVGAFGPNATANGNSFQHHQRSDRNQRSNLELIRAEAKRIEQHATQLNAGLIYSWWQQYLPDKFRPADLEEAARQVRVVLACDAVIISQLDTLRATAHAADAEADRILDGRANGLERLRDLVLRVLNSAPQVASGIDRILASFDKQPQR